MKTVHVQRDIAAAPAQVWSLLTDAEILTKGGLGILRLEGAIRLGERLKLWSEVSPKRAFALKVVEFQPDTRMRWQGGMPFGLFTGSRVFELTETPSGCGFRMQETFTGPLSGPICRSMPDLAPSFEKFADGLKHHAEERAI